MPGHKCRLVNEQVQEAFSCRVCGLLLRDPVQNISTGHHYCSTCTDDDSGDNFPPDKAVYKQSMDQEVYCSNQYRGCKWKGLLKIFIKEHAVACVQKELSMLEKDEKIYTHYSTTHAKNLYYFTNLSEEESDIGIELPLTETVYIKNEKSVVEQIAMQKTTGVPEKLLTSKTLPKSPQLNFDDSAEYVDKCTSDLLEKNSKFKEGLQGFGAKLEVHSKRTNATFSQLCTRCNAMPTPYENYRIKVKDEHTRLYSVDFMDYSKVGKPQSGSCMQCHWGLDINKCLQRKADPLLSPPWYTLPCGYLLQVLLYLNGYGRCLGTHASVFVTIVRGDHDDGLPWPVTGTLSMGVLDSYQNARPIVKTFRLSCSYDKPTQESDTDIIATGCLDFIPKEILLDKRYVKDGIMRLEFKFDPRRLHREMS